MTKIKSSVFTLLRLLLRLTGREVRGRPLLEPSGITRGGGTAPGDAIQGVAEFTKNTGQTRRQLKWSLCSRRWLKRSSVFSGKNRGDTVSCRPGDTNHSDATAWILLLPQTTINATTFNWFHFHAPYHWLARHRKDYGVGLTIYYRSPVRFLVGRALLRNNLLGTLSTPL